MADSPQAAGTKDQKRLADRAERSLKEANRRLKESGEGNGAQKALAHLDEARALAILEVAEAFRNRGSGAAG